MPGAQGIRVAGSGDDRRRGTRIAVGPGRGRDRTHGPNLERRSGPEPSPARRSAPRAAWHGLRPRVFDRRRPGNVDIPSPVRGKAGTPNGARRRRSERAERDRRGFPSPLAGEGQGGGADPARAPAIRGRSQPPTEPRSCTSRGRSSHHRRGVLDGHGAAERRRHPVRGVRPRRCRRTRRRGMGRRGISREVRRRLLEDGGGAVQLTGPWTSDETSASGQVFEFRLWAALTEQSRGGLHVFLPIADRGVDALVHRISDGTYFQVQAKSRSTLHDGEVHLGVWPDALAHDEVLIVAGLVVEGGLGPTLLVAPAADFKRLAYLTSDQGKPLYSAEFGMRPRSDARWLPWLVPLERLVERFGAPLGRLEEALAELRPEWRSDVGSLG